MMKGLRKIPKLELDLNYIMKRAGGNKDLYDCDSDIKGLNYIIDEKGLLIASAKKGYLLIEEEDIESFVEELNYLKNEVKRWKRIS
ncbi:MAG: hypothetical protein JJE03_07725 [Peptostreptococcaceae bacterium]|nr:hypothetical protein [Peptostreptococcaceae bacterium]